MPKAHKILITGSSGMLGVDLWQELINDYELFGIDLVENPRAEAQHFYRCDITDKKGVIDVIKTIRPDIAIHAAAWTDVDGCELDKKKAYKINSEGTKNVAVACKKIDSVLIYLSTDFIFDGKKKGPYKEIDRPNPLSVYAKSKLEGEKAIRKILKKYFVLRTSWLFGRYGKNFVDMILKKAEREKVLKVVNDQIGSPTYTKDLAKAIHKLLDKVSLQHYGIYHVSNAGSVSWYEYAKEIVRLAGSEVKVVPISSRELARPAKRPAMSVLDNTKFMKFSGYRMRHWKYALREYLS